MKMVMLSERVAITVNRVSVGLWGRVNGTASFVMGQSDASCIKSGRPAAVQKLTVLRDVGHLK
jgi:hypothetical protein